MSAPVKGHGRGRGRTQSQPPGAASRPGPPVQAVVRGRGFRSRTVAPQDTRRPGPPEDHQEKHSCVEGAASLLRQISLNDSRMSIEAAGFDHAAQQSTSDLVTAAQQSTSDLVTAAAQQSITCDLINNDLKFVSSCLNREKLPRILSLFNELKLPLQHCGQCQLIKFLLHLACDKKGELWNLYHDNEFKYNNDWQDILHHVANDAFESVEGRVTSLIEHAQNIQVGDRPLLPGPMLFKEIVATVESNLEAEEDHPSHHYSSKSNSGWTTSCYMWQYQIFRIMGHYRGGHVSTLIPDAYPHAYLSFERRDRIDGKMFFRVTVSNKAVEKTAKTAKAAAEETMANVIKGFACGLMVYETQQFVSIICGVARGQTKSIRNQVVEKKRCYPHIAGEVTRSTNRNTDARRKIIFYGLPDKLEGAFQWMRRKVHDQEILQIAARLPDIPQQGTVQPTTPQPLATSSRATYNTTYDYTASASGWSDLLP